MSNESPFPSGTSPQLRTLLNGDVQIVDTIEDAPLLTIKGHNGVDPEKWIMWLAGQLEIGRSLTG